MWSKLKVQKFFKKQEKEQIMAAIEAAERLTSGEIRVHVESKSGGETLTRAAEIFNSLGMAKTDLRNGVLIYLAVLERKFAIIGDQGINQAVPANFWDDTKNRMEALFRQGKFSEGVCLGIKLAGEHLAKYFPYRSGDVNELPNEISAGN